jgi:hypothetical protein
MAKRTFGREKQDFGPRDQVMSLRPPFVVALAEEFGHALRAAQEARVNHSESVDLTGHDSDSRIERQGPSLRSKLLKRVHMLL